MIHGVHFDELKSGQDERGVVREFYRRSKHDRELGLVRGWAQINVTETRQGAIRGLHAESTDKLVGVVSGSAFGAWVDGRPESPTFGQLQTAQLLPGEQVFVPSGVLNGFQSLSEPCQYLYCFSAEWTPSMEGFAITPFDEELRVPWPITVRADDFAMVSRKDASALTWSQVRDRLR